MVCQEVAEEAHPYILGALALRGRHSPTTVDPGRLALFAVKGFSHPLGKPPLGLATPQADDTLVRDRLGGWQPRLSRKPVAAAVRHEE